MGRTNKKKNEQWFIFNGLINLIQLEEAREERERYRGELGVKLTKIENLTFRGGGGKAIAYGGALEEITDKVPDFWKNLRRVGGTSAGALTSLLISVGYLPQEVSNLLKSFDFEAIIKPGIGSATSQLDKDLKSKLMSALKLCAIGIQGAYATKQTQSFLDVFLPLWKARKFTGLSDGEVLREKLKELVKNALITQGFSTTTKDGKAYLTHSGNIIGENQPLLNQNLGLLTLGHWKIIVEGSSNSQHVYKHLYIVTSCVSGREMGVEVFNSESGSYDDVVMIDPVACSMSYPFAIEPQKVRRVTSDGQSKLSSESYLDGGMLMNDPKKLFDAHGYVDPQDKLGDKRFPRYNKKTLSLTLIPEKKEAPPEFDMPEEKEVKTIFGLIKVFASFYLHAETYLRAEGYTERYREVAISDCGVTVRDLNMSEENKKKLQDSGRSTMQKFMKQLGDPDKPKTLSDDSKETFDPTHPVGPSVKK